MTIPNLYLEPALEALVRLGESGVPAGPVGVPAARARRVLRAALDDLAEAREALVKTHAELDEAGEPRTEPVCGPDGKPTEQLQYVLSDPQQFEHEARELFEGSSDVEVKPLAMDALGACSVPGRDLDLLIEAGLFA